MENKLTLQLRDNTNELAEIKTIPQGIEYIKKLQTILDHAKRIKLNAEQQNIIAEQKIRSQRTVGKMIMDGQKKGEIRIVGQSFANSSCNIMLHEQPKTLSELGIERRADAADWQKIALLPDEHFERYFLDNKKGEYTTSGILDFTVHFIKKENVRNAEEDYEESIKNIDDFDIDIYTTDKKFNIIYADPPWEYWEGGFKNQSLHYPTMPIDEIGALPVSNIAADNCILFLWVTFPILRESFDLIEAWGFKYSTCGFVWLKKNKNTDSWFFGNGSWTRANTELCLIATKGMITRLNASISQIVEAPISEHSQKPPIIRQLITDLVGGLPRIELFSRSTDDNGWFNWGNKI